MRFAFFLALTISLALMTGCKNSEQQEEHFTQWREQYLSSGDLSLTAEVTSSDDEGACTYKLLYEKRGEDQSIEIIEPELISKVKAYVKEDETELSYDGAILEVGNGVSDRLSPMTALPVFVEFLEDGYLKGVWTEKTEGEDTLTAELELPEKGRMIIWLNDESREPIAASIRSEEKAELMIRFQ